MKKTLVTSIMLASIVSSCNKEEVITPNSTKDTQTSVQTTREEGNKLFARALSKALAEIKSLPSILKSEAQKEFDNNLDVLYHLVRDKKLENGSDIRSVIAKYWEGTPESFKAFENQSPLLNLYAADLSIFDKKLSIEKWDTQNEVAVALRDTSGEHVLYINGDSVGRVGNNEVPAIPTFVLNQNKRVEVASRFRSVSQGDKFTYKFINDIYDNSKTNTLRTAYVENEEPIDDDWVLESELDPEVIKAWNVTKDGSRSRQRALVYYTPESDDVNRAFDEYLYRFKIAPNAYHNIAGATSETDDPKIKTGDSFATYTRYATYEEIINKLWTEGSFMFVFEVLTPMISGETVNKHIYIPVSPREAFRVNPTVVRRHPTMFRRTRYTYSIDPKNLEAKWIYPHKTKLHSYTRVEGSWDLKTQGLSKFIRFSETDKGGIKQRTESYGIEFLSKSSMSLDLKFGEIVNSFTANVSSEHKMTRNVTFKTEHTDNDDNLGSHSIYFTDPIINAEKIEGSSKKYMPKELTTGAITFVLMPLKHK